MPWVTLTSYGMETRKSKNGKPYKCFVVRGIKKGYQGEPDTNWERALFPNSEGEVIEAIKKFKAGDTVDIKTAPDGQYTRIVSVSPVRVMEKSSKPGRSKAEPKGAPEAKADTQAAGAEAPAPAAPNDDRYVQVIYTQCLNVAANLVIEMMKQADNFKGLIKKSATPELVEQMVTDLADRFYKQSLAHSKKGAMDQEDEQTVVPPDDEGANQDLGEEVPDGGTSDDDPEIPF